MDAGKKEQWRWKFYRVALHLNAVIFCVALTVIAALKAPALYRTPSLVILIVLDIFLVYTFLRNYRTTKAWLDEYGTSPEIKDPERRES